jgi:flagellar hook-associated protein 3 FlgL
MGLAQDRLGKTQLQLTNGKEVLKASDAPEKAATITRLNSVIARQESYLDTVRTVEDKLSQQETAATSASDVITRLKELAVKSANDSYSPQDRKYIDIEVRELRDQLLSLANTQDVNGNYIFSGSRVGNVAFAADANGRLMYQGDQTVSPAGVGDQREVATNRAGTNPFGRLIRVGTDGEPVPVGFFQVIEDLSAALQANNVSGLQRAVGEVGTLQDSMTESLAHIGASRNVLQSQTSLAEETLLRLKSTLSDAQDVDYSEAITRMNKDMLALEAAQSSFAKISQLNLFDYLR